MQSRTYQTRSLDEGASILNREWSPHRMLIPRGRGELRLRFSIRSLTPHMSLSSLAYGTGVLVRPEERADVLLFQMPRMGTAVASYPWGNTPLDARHFALIDAKHVTQVHYGADVDMLVLRISLPRVMAQLTQLLGRDPHENINFNPGMAQGDASWDAWAPVGAALEALQRSPLPAFPRESMEALESMAIHTLLLTHPSNYLDALHQPRRGLAPRHVRMAEEFILANLHRPLPTAEIARHAQVSVRALFDAFRAFRQSTPSAYARQARLQGARQQLLQGSDCVADVARRWGFPHAGHFAALYRRQFGEPPAQALRARAKLH